MKQLPCVQLNTKLLPSLKNQVGFNKSGTDIVCP